MPSSVRVGSRPPSSCLIFSNSSGVRPCSRIISGVMALGVIAEVVIGNLYFRISPHFSHANSYQFCVERAPSPAAFDIAVDPDFDLISSLQFRNWHPSILSQMKSVIVGTAGHIDHGKTALVKALTGIDADRLEEEKRRGITIDIGFAPLELPAPDGRRLRLGFVDVPGHERFVRNMLAGVGGIDLVLLVVAADESIMPQTREHFDICRLLSVRSGIAVLTKSDAVDAETLGVVRSEVEDFLRESFLGNPNPIVAVSSLTGVGMDDLKRELVRVASEVPARDSKAMARLPIDRVFTMKGFGTV